MSKISRIEIVDFRFEVDNIAQMGGGQRLGYSKGAKLPVTKNAIVIETDDGLRGEYVTNLVASPATRGEMAMLAPLLIGRDHSEREEIFDDLKREIRQWSGLGQGPLDIALWDLEGKALGASISRLLGGYRKSLPAYASTYLGDDAGGLDSPEAYEDFAEECYALGYRVFKIHGWNDGDARREAANVLHCAKALGGRMTLMLDACFQLRRFSDALYVGRACDKAGYFWYEDPMRDSGRSAHLHRKLRQFLKTPILITEYIRGLEPKADIITAEATDFLRVNPEYYGGITGAMKTAHLAEAFGLDCEVHACGPAQRHVMSAMRNSNFYEVALVGPDMPNMIAPVYACGYSDQLDCIAADGTVPVPDGPGLGVTHDWDFIDRHRVDRQVFAA